MRANLVLFICCFCNSYGRRMFRSWLASPRRPTTDLFEYRKPHKASTKSIPATVVKSSSRSRQLSRISHLLLAHRPGVARRSARFQLRSKVHPVARFGRDASAFEDTCDEVIEAYDRNEVATEPRAYEEESIQVFTVGSAASRERRVRRMKRPGKEERWQMSKQMEGYQRMSTFTNFSSIDISEAITLVANFSGFGDRIIMNSYTDVLTARFYTRPGLDDLVNDTFIKREAFIFPYGSVVLWGFTLDEELSFLRQLEPCCKALSLEGEDSSIDDLDDLRDSEFMLFEQSCPDTEECDGSTSVKNNVISLVSKDPLEKLAVSFAFAQSGRLAVFEEALDRISVELRPIPLQLAAKGKCKLKLPQVARLSGRVFLERSRVNLYSNILDTPEFFWEADQYEPLYRRVNRYLDIEDRVRILNERIDIVKDLLETLTSQLEVRHSNRLEVIIIWLIIMEIGVELVKDATFPMLGIARWPKRVLFLLTKFIGSGG